MASHNDILQFFEYKHLPKDLQPISEQFNQVAVFVGALPSNPERTMALRKLLEAKDCAVRAAIYRETGYQENYKIHEGKPVINGGAGQVVPFADSKAVVLETKPHCAYCAYPYMSEDEVRVSPILAFCSQDCRLTWEAQVGSQPMSIADVCLSPEGDAGQQAKQLGLNFERSFLADVLASLIKAGASLKLAETLTETLEFARGSGAYLRRFSSQFAPFLDCFTEQLRKVNVIVVSSVRASDGSVLIAIGKDEEVLTAALDRRKGGPPGPAPVEVSETGEGPTVDELVKRAMHFQGGAMAAGSNSYPISCKDVCDQASVILSEMGILSCSLELEPGKIHFFAGGQQEALDGCIEAAKRRVSNPNWDRQA